MTKRITPRAGSTYIAVMGVATLVTLIGMTSMHIARLERRQTTAMEDNNYARSIAQSSVEYAVAKIKLDSNWRTSHSHNVEYALTPSNFNATMRYLFLDHVDSNLSNDNTQDVEIQGIGRWGNSEYRYSVTYKPSLTSSQNVTPPILQSYVGVATSTQQVNESNFLGQHFIPTLPAGAISWNISHIDVYLENHGSPSATMTFNFYSSNAAGRPNTLIESLAIPESTLPPESSPDYHSFNLSTTTGLTPGQGYCFTMEHTGGGNSAIVHYETGVTTVDTHLVRNQGIWHTAPTETLKYRVNGSYTTEVGTGEFTISPGSWRRVSAP